MTGCLAGVGVAADTTQAQAHATNLSTAAGAAGAATAAEAEEPWSAYVVPAAASMQGSAGSLQHRAPSIPAARPAALPQGPVLVQPGSLSLSHRQGQLAVRVPNGARNLTLQLKRHADFVFGTAYYPEKVAAADLDWYKSMTASMFQGLTPETQFKWFYYERVPGQYQQAKDGLDRDYIQFAQDAGFSLVRGHTLEWSKVDFGPFWAHQLNCSEYVAALKHRVVRDVTLFKGKFQQYDVFNEIIEAPGLLDTCNLWDTAFPDIFKLAHETDPEAQLCINDLGLIEAGNALKLIRIIKEHLWAHDAPIHCIGIQAHFEYAGINMTHQQQQLDLLATLGLDMFITEFTLFTSWAGPPILPDHPDGWPVSYLDEQTQADMTTQLLKFWFSHPAVKGVFMWGWWDSNIWIPGAGIYTVDRRPKLAAAAVQQLLQQELSTNVTAEAPAAGWMQFKGFYGEYVYSFVNQAGKQKTGVLHFGRGAARRQSLLQADTS
uniref:GH10 domain-containing protein n=1 Tax=Tetradesmus obliquus TaxID=3088 RepID=A0A383WQC4_TETOB|eukprot:jgi/Sobl393_1/6413/SZX79514.1